MVFLRIFSDGTIYPPLKPSSLVIKVDNGRCSVGRLHTKGLNNTHESIRLKEPLNADFVNYVAREFIQIEMPLVFEKKHVVFILCPNRIESMAEWASTN
jgi:hypothetical protein